MFHVWVAVKVYPTGGPKLTPIVLDLYDILQVSLDYLTGKITSEIDKTIVDKVMTIQNLPQEERDRILFTIDALVRDAKSRFAYAS